MARLSIAPLGCFVILALERGGFNGPEELLFSSTQGWYDTLLEIPHSDKPTQYKGTPLVVRLAETARDEIGGVRSAKECFHEAGQQE
jgi:hypothetical protein